MPRVVGLGEPEHAKGRPALAQHLVTEAGGHDRVARLALLDVELLGVGDGQQPRAERAGAVVHVAEAVGILEICGARRHVGHDDAPAVAGQPLGEGRSEEGAPRRLAHALAKLGLGHGQADQPRAFVQDHGVAEETMAARVASGGDRGRGDARHGREDAAAGRIALDGARKGGEGGRRVGANHIRPEAVADHDDRSASRGAHGGSVPDFGRGGIARQAGARSLLCGGDSPHRDLTKEGVLP